MIARSLFIVALGTMRLARAILPARLEMWGLAMEREAAEAARPGAALGFAFGCLLCALRETMGGMTMDWTRTWRERPRRLAALCAVGAVGLGLAYMAGAGAPLRYLAINAGALSIGLVALAMGGPAPNGRLAGGTALALGVVLLATTLLGARVEGAARWVPLGGLFLQPSLIVLPLLALCFARARDGLAAFGIVLAALALAVQPDRAMAGALAAGVAALALVRPGRMVTVALAAAIAGFGAALMQADTQPAMPYVDRILYSSFGLHPLAGLAVVAGAALMIVPALVGWRHDAAERGVHAAFGAIWLAILLAAALGNYPTPLVGYGGSAILGYLLSQLALPTRIRPRTAGGTASSRPLEETTRPSEFRRGRARAFGPGGRLARTLS